MTGRVTNTEIEVGGVTLPAGESVLMLLGAANRDPAHYTEPDKLDVGRQNVRPMSFGGGIHHCLGAQLTRLEAELVFTALIERLPTLELPGKAAKGTRAVRPSGEMSTREAPSSAGSSGSQSRNPSISQASVLCSGRVCRLI